MMKNKFYYKVKNFFFSSDLIRSRLKFFRIGLLIFIILFFISVCLMVYSFELILYFCPDVVIDYLNNYIAKGYGFSFIGSFLPISYYFFNVGRKGTAGIYNIYKLKIQRRTVNLLKYLGFRRPLYKRRRLKKKFFRVFFSRISPLDKSKLYVIHKIGSFNLKNFIINYKFFDFLGFNFVKNKKSLNYKDSFFKNEIRIMQKRKELQIKEEKLFLKVMHYRRKLENTPSGNTNRNVLFFRTYEKPKNFFSSLFPDDYYYLEYSNYYNLNFMNLFLNKISNINLLNITKMNVKLKSFLYKKFGIKNTNYFFFRKFVKNYDSNIIYPSLGLNELLKHKQILFFNLNKKLNYKIFLPFFGIRDNIIYYYFDYHKLFLRPNFKHRLDNSTKISKLLKYFYYYGFNLIYWNWFNSDSVLFNYFFQMSPMFIDEVYFVSYNNRIRRMSRSLEELKKLTDFSFMYRANNFWLLYMLYLSDMFDLTVKPIFDGVSDNTLKFNRGLGGVRRGHRRIYITENNQQNDFFIDFPDYDYFLVKNFFKFEPHQFQSIFRHWRFRKKLTPYDLRYGDVSRRGLRKYLEEVYSSGNYSFFDRRAGITSADYTFFKNFYFKYKFNSCNIYYLKHLNIINEFYSYMVDLKRESFYFNFFVFFKIFYDLIIDKLKYFLLSIFFYFFYYLNLYYIPFKVFLNAYNFNSFILEWFVLNINSFFNYILSLFFADVITRYVNLKKFFFFFSVLDLQLIFMFVGQLCVFVLICSLFLYFIEQYDYFDEKYFETVVFFVISIFLILFWVSSYTYPPIFPNSSDF